MTTRHSILHSVPTCKGPFTWKEDDPSARIILESSFGLHAKTRLLGSTLNLVYMKFTCKILCSARLQSKMAGEKDKKLVLGVLPYLLALITAFQHQFAIIYNLIFQTQQQRAMILHLSHTATISRFQIARRKIRRGPVRRLWRAPGRTEEWWTNLWTGKLPDHEWKTNLRMTRAVFMSVADELRYFLEPREDCPRRGDVLSVEKQLAMTLYYLKDQGSLRMTANSFGVAICTLSVVLRKVCTWNWWQGLYKVIFI